MKYRLALAAIAVLALAFAIAPSVLGTQHTSAAVRGVSLSGLNHVQRRILSGYASFEDNIGVPANPAQARVAARMTSTTAGLCPADIGRNVVVNQNCLNITDPDRQGRGQAENETAISEYPANPRQLVGGFNRSC